MLVLLFSIALNLSGLFWMLVPLAESSPAPKRISNHNIALSSNRPLDIVRITKLNLFGAPENIPSKSIKTNEVKAIVAAETSLNITLRGLRKGQGLIKSTAIIENSQRIQDIYSVGDKISGHKNVVIHEIYSQYLILRRAGKYERLTLFSVLNKKQEQKSTDEQVNKRVIEEVRRIPVIDKTRNKALSKSLSDIADKLKSSPLSLDGTMIIESFQGKAGLKGYKVSPGRDKLLFAQMGLVKGDVVTKLNNIELDGPGKIMSLMSELSSVEDLEVSVIRRGSPLTFRYKIK